MCAPSAIAFRALSWAEGGADQAWAKEHAMRHYQVRDVMTANPMTVTPATPLKNVAEILVRGRIGVVPVLTPQGRVAGVVTEADLLRKEQLQRDPDGYHWTHLPYRIRRDIATAETAGELMDRYPATAPAGTSVPEAARLMDRHQSRFLLVTSEDGKLLGVVTPRDLLRVILRPDAAIKAEISRDILSVYLGTNPALVQVDVTDGVVRLSGELERKSMLPATLRAVRAVDGVIDVESHLGYAIDDMRLPHGVGQPDTPSSPVIGRRLT
jgi:CBS domain-containing protein